MEKNRVVLRDLLTVCILVSCMLLSWIGMTVHAETTEKQSPIMIDFESENSLEGWHVGTKADAVAIEGRASASLASDSETGNHYLKVTGNGKYSMYIYDLPEDVTKAIMEYRVMIPAGSSDYLYLPSFGGPSSAEIKLMDLGRPNWLGVHGVGSGLGITTDNYGSLTKIADIKADTWYKIMISFDNETKEYGIWVDGTKIDTSTINFKALAGGVIDSIWTGFYNSSDSICIDDLKVWYGENAEEATPLFTQKFDFSDNEMPSGWKKLYNEASTRKIRTEVEDVSGNSALVLDATGDTTTAATEYYDIYAIPLTQQVDKAVLEYRFMMDESVDVGDYIYLPSFMTRDGQCYQPFPNWLGITGGNKLSFSADAFSHQTDLKDIQAGQWYTVLIEYDNVQKLLNISVDGKATSIQGTCTNPDIGQKILSIGMGFWGTNGSEKIYVDDITIKGYETKDVSDGGSDNTDEVKTEFEEVFLDFENSSLEGWNGLYDYSSYEGNKMEIVAEDNNHVVAVTQEKSQANHYMQCYNLSNDVTKAVLEYKFKLEEGTDGWTYLPGFGFQNPGGANQYWQQVWIVVRGSSDLLYSYDNNTYYPIKTISTGEWYELKVVQDCRERILEISINGELVPITGTMESADNWTINHIAMGFWRTSSTDTFYVDDLKVTKFVDAKSMKFEQDAYTIPVGATYDLRVISTPENSSLTGSSYVSSDPEVATVDAVGKVTTLKEGTAVITATPSAEGIEPFTTVVTVQGKITGTIAAATDFISAFKVGGHQYLDPVVTTGHGYDKEVEYASEDESVVTVDEWGEVVAVGVGNAKVTISLKANPEVKTTIPVSVTEAGIMRKIYVSPDGTGDGSSEGTPTTLVGAIAILETIDKAQMTGNVEVILADGYYYQAQELKLNQKHGGNNQYYVIFKSANEGKVTIGGGVTVAGNSFTKVEGKDYYVADISSLGADFSTRQMYVDGVRAVRARTTSDFFKNAEYATIDGDVVILCDNTELLGIDCTQMELEGYSHFVHYMCGVESITQTDDGRIMISMNEHWNKAINFNDNYYWALLNHTYLMNSLALLDEPGEWYLDEAEDKLYYLPRAWEDMSEAEITLPALDIWKTDNSCEGALISVKGESSENPVQNITFKGINFADVTWLKASKEGYYHPSQNNYQSLYTSPDAAVYVAKANSIHFEGCSFTRIGSNALKLVDGTQNSQIVGNHFMDISAGAISIGNGNYTGDKDNFNPSDPKKMMKNCDVLNNYIHDVATDYAESAAITVGFAANVDLSYNEFFHMPMSAFHIGMGWSTKFNNITKNLKVTHNFVHDYMYGELGDGGGIYVLGNTSGVGYNLVSDNYFRNQGEYPGVLYADNGSTWWKFTNNVVDLSESVLAEGVDRPVTGSVRWSFINSGASNIQMTGNYTSTGLATNSAASDATNIVTDNTVCADLNWPQGAQSIIANSGLKTEYAALRNNQAERIVSALPGEGKILGLSVGETFDIGLSVTDGKDRAVSDSEMIVKYEIAEQSADNVLSVSQEGILMAHGAGKAVLRIYVVSNKILTTIEKEVYVGDEPTAIKLESVEDEIVINMGFAGQELKFYAVSGAGRKIDLADVQYEIADKSIAVVENGTVKPVGIGDTILTVKGTAEKKSLTSSFKVVVKAAPAFVADNLEEIFAAENEDKWGNGKGKEPVSWQLTDGKKIETTLSSSWVFSGATYQNELMTFKLSIDAKGSWPSIVFRSQEPDKAPGADSTTGYIICMGDQGLQLQRFNGSERTVFYGSVPGFTPIYGPDITPFALSDNELHEVQIGALNEADGVRLFMSIDGEIIFNVMDTAENAVTDAGYFGLVGIGDVFVLEKMDISSEAGKVDITVDNVGAETSGVKLTAPEGGWVEGDNTFTVTSSKACVVMVSNDGGQTYTRLSVGGTVEGGCSYKVTGVTAETIISVALAGDVNGDGKISTLDSMKVKSAALGKETLGSRDALIADVNGDGRITAIDSIQVKAAVLNRAELEW